MEKNNPDYVEGPLPRPKGRKKGKVPAKKKTEEIVDLDTMRFHPKMDVDPASLSEEEKVEVLCIALRDCLQDNYKRLIECGADVTKFCYGKSPMYYALCNRTGSLDIVRLVVEAGFPINGIIEQGFNFTTLHGAVSRNDLPFVQFILETPFDRNVKDKIGLAPLHYAVQEGNCEMLELLVNKGADVNVVCNNDTNYTPLFFAIAQRNVNAVKVLLELGANANHACKHGRETLTPLHFAAGLCELRIVQLLLDSGADPNYALLESKETPLHVSAANYTKTKREKISGECIVRMLIKKGSDPKALNEADLTPLHVSVRNCNFEVAKLLMQLDNQALNTNYAFHEIMKCNDRSLIEMSLSYGGDLNRRDPEGRYPAGVFVSSMIYKYASDHRSMNTTDIIDVVKIIWGCGFPVELTIPKNITWSKPGNPAFLTVLELLVTAQNTLRQGVKSNNAQQVKQSMERGAVVWCSYRDLQYPLHSVASKGNINTLKLFLSKDPVIVNFVNKDGKTPLHLAAEYGHLEACILLLENGAVFNARTKKCKESPLELAKKRKRRDVVKLLENINNIFKALTIKKKLAKLDPFWAVVNCKNKQGYTLMETALKKQLMPLAKKILMKKVKREMDEVKVIVSQHQKRNRDEDKVIVSKHQKRNRN